MHAHNVAFKFSLSLLISKRLRHQSTCFCFFTKAIGTEGLATAQNAREGRSGNNNAKQQLGEYVKVDVGIWWAMYLVQLSFSTPRSDSIKSISGCNKIPVDSLWVLLLTQAEAFNQRHSHGGITVNSSVFCWDAWFPIAKNQYLLSSLGLIAGHAQHWQYSNNVIPSDFHPVLDFPACMQEGLCSVGAGQECVAPRSKVEQMTCCISSSPLFSVKTDPLHSCMCGFEFASFCTQRVQHYLVVF